MTRRLFTFAFVSLIALPLSAATTEIASKPAKPLHISQGAEIKLQQYAVPGKTTVFDFYSEYCGPCMRMAPALEKLHASRSDIVVVKVDINRPGVKGIDWKSPVVKQYGLHSIPHFKVFGPDGKMLAEDTTEESKARRMVQKWLE